MRLHVDTSFSRVVVAVLARVYRFIPERKVESVLLAVQEPSEFQGSCKLAVLTCRVSQVPTFLVRALISLFRFK